MYIVIKEGQSFTTQSLPKKVKEQKLCYCNNMKHYAKLTGACTSVFTENFNNSCIIIKVKLQVNNAIILGLQ